MKKLLFILPGPTMLRVSTGWYYEWLSKKYSGDIISPTFNDFDIQNIDAFNFHWLKYISGNPIHRNLYTFVKTFLAAYRLCHIKKNRYDAIISPNPLITGLIVLLIGALFKIKTIIEVNGNFKEAFRFGPVGVARLSRTDKIKEFAALKITSFCLTHCDMVKILYKDQLVPLNIPHHKIKATAYFPNFVAISEFAKHPRTDEKYILLIGFPWYLKGVDILIQAFNDISADFPDYNLKIYGWNPADKEYFEKMAEGNNKIYFGKALILKEVIEVMAACSLYVQASRTEGIARVLREAMACQKPIIASNVGGTSAIIKDGYNGLLFEKDNTSQLAEKMRLLLSDDESRNRIALNGFNYVHEHLSEESYLASYQNMVDRL